MGDSSGKSTDRLHFLRLQQLFFQVHGLGDVLGRAEDAHHLPVRPVQGDLVDQQPHVLAGQVARLEAQSKSRLIGLHHFLVKP